MKRTIATAITVAAAILAPLASSQAQPTPVALNASAPQELSTASQALVPVSGAARVLSAPNGFSDINSGSQSSWSAFKSGPEPSVAWMFALGILGMIALRRMRAW